MPDGCNRNPFTAADQMTLQVELLNAGLALTAQA